MLPFHVSAASKKISIKDMVVDGNHVYITFYEPYAKGVNIGTSTFLTSTKMQVPTFSKDKFHVKFVFDESELEYLSRFKSVDFIYPRNFINSDTADTFYSTLNVSDYLRAVEESNKPWNQLIGIF